MSTVASVRYRLPNSTIYEDTLPTAGATSAVEIHWWHFGPDTVSTWEKKTRLRVTGADDRSTVGDTDANTNATEDAIVEPSLDIAA